MTKDLSMQDDPAERSTAASSWGPPVLRLSLAAWRVRALQPTPLRISAERRT